MSDRLQRTLERKIDAKDIDEARYDRNTPYEVGSGAAPGSTAEKNKAASISAAEKQIVAALVRMPPQRVPRSLESKIDAKDIDEARYDRNIPSEVGSGAAPGSTAAETGGASISAVEKQIVAAFVRKTTPRILRTDESKIDAEDIEDDWLYTMQRWIRSCTRHV